MWGDPQRAIVFDSSDELANLLFQVSGPAHIPWNDGRWQELFLGFEVWVHLERNATVRKASASMARHASTSSNLAAMALHVSRMLKELQSTQPQESKGTNAFTHRIALVGKARATAGALRLFSLLVHTVMSTCADSDSTITISEVFVYHSREEESISRNRALNAGEELMSCLLGFISHFGSTPDASRSAMEEDDSSLLTQVPELYDATVFSMELLLILLSIQLYQPMISSMQKQETVEHKQAQEVHDNYFLDLVMSEGETRQSLKKKKMQQQNALLKSENGASTIQRDQQWSPQSILKACISWLTDRPAAPPRSIAHHSADLAREVVRAKGETIGPDGMYEKHVVVMAAKPGKAETMEVVSQSQALAARHSRPPSRLILDATKGVLVLSSTLILLPFRLVSLAFGLWGGLLHPHHPDPIESRMISQLAGSSNSSSSQAHTNDVLWLSDSPLADSGSTLLLLLINNHRANGNAFRTELASLNDNRWEGSSSGDPDPLGHVAGNDEMNSMKTIPIHNGSRLTHHPSPNSRQLLMANFEFLFEAFGTIAHTEQGALILYTILQTCPIFAASVAVRSDLDTLVLPMLRTLYFSSSTMHFSSEAASQHNYPFRSISQLYLILILLLLFSQDASFGPDAFRRVTVNVAWYKERNLKEINLGSVLLLVLLRCITFNTNRLADAFLLSNCCAVLMNLSPHVCNLHEYAAMRLASVTMSSMKRYSSLVAKNGGKVSVDEDLSTNVGMYGEVSRTLLRVVKHCMGPKNIETNLHLVYALVYHQGEFNRIVSDKNCPFKESEIGRIKLVISEAAAAIQEDGNARTAPQTLTVLQKSIDKIKQVVSSQPLRSSTSEASADFTFTYEEEADPEIFFVPYIWEVVVCVVTSSSIDWDKKHIKVFPLLQSESTGTDHNQPEPPKGYADDVDNVV